MSFSISQPEVDKLYAGGSTSGTLGSSGTLEGTLSGPWLIEEQTMDIEYVRVPHYQAGNFQFGLSGSQIDATHTVNRTNLQVLVTASYKRSKVYQNFATSAFAQNQKFEYNQSLTDPYGNSYGDTSALGTSGLGVAGSVNTVQKYYNRREWDDTTDTSAEEFCRGTLHYYNNASAQLPGSNILNFADGETYMGDYRHQDENYAPGTFLGGARPFVSGEKFINNQGGELNLMGDYNVDTEISGGELPVINMINKLGTDVQNIFYFGTGLDFSAGPILPNTPGSTWAAFRTEGCPSYRSFRHDFS